jgi:hypothetical protein
VKGKTMKRVQQCVWVIICVLVPLAAWPGSIPTVAPEEVGLSSEGLERTDAATRFFDAWEAGDTGFVRRAFSEAGYEKWHQGRVWREWHPFYFSPYNTSMNDNAISATVDGVCCARSDDGFRLCRMTVMLSKEHGRWRVDDFAELASAKLDPLGGEVPEYRVMWPLVNRNAFKTALYAVNHLMDSVITRDYRDALAMTTAWPENHKMSCRASTDEDKALLFGFLGLHQRAEILFPANIHEVVEVSPGEFVVNGFSYLCGGGELCLATYTSRVTKHGGMWLVDRFGWQDVLPLRPPESWREKLGIGDSPIAFPADSQRLGGLPIFVDMELLK